jgi:Asp-tRNA(Asn)/Glu-tRNA(Gln) amidotransferase A subunit family amidase
VDRIRFLSTIGAAAGIALALSPRALAQQAEPPRLEPGHAVERDLAPREVHTYRVALDSGALMRVALVQRGIDLVLTAYGPDGGRLAEVDSSDDGAEPELFALARRGGDQRLEIRAFDTTATPGSYRLELLEVLGPAQVASIAALAPPRPAITREDVQGALALSGLTYTDPELALLLRGNGLLNRRNAYEAMRSEPLPNAVMPALVFEPIPPAIPVADRAPRFARAPRGLRRPADLEEVAFWPITDLAALLRTRQVTSIELTRMYLSRLQRFDSVLHAVVTLPDSLALDQARRADREMAAGRYRGPLHGIPFGVKDLYAVPGYPTTWGAGPYRDQVLDVTATAVRKLEDAGAVLVAKLSTGALAQGDLWFRERTRNPWNPAQGSSGSSAGPAAAVSAGLVPFALGTETLGSIISPASTTGVTGLRPSFGRVSRAGVMALSWSMDKPGPLCRSAEDCAIVFDAIRGRDAADPATVDVPFPYDAGASLRGMRIGYLASAFEGRYRGADLDRQVLDVLRGQGATLVPLELPDRRTQAMRIVLVAEAAAAFDELTRSGRDSLLRDQGPGAWPNTFRSARLIPAVEYLQANRLRRLLQEDMDTLLRRVDAWVSPAFRGDNLLVTNLTGHPCVAVPDGFVDGRPTSITFCASMYGEAAALRVARAYQAVTPWEERHPDAFVAGRK